MPQWSRGGKFLLKEVNGAVMAAPHCRESLGVFWQIFGDQSLCLLQ